MKRPLRAAAACAAGVLALGVVAPAPGSAQQQGLVVELFAQYVEALRQQAGIPGLSAAIVNERRIVWERGFGYEDLEAPALARPDTPYPVGDLAQAFAAVLLLRCTESGQLSLDDSIRRWTTAIPEPGATVRHVLTHTSEGVPGTVYKYDAVRYSALGAVAEACAGQPYRQTLAHAVLDPLAMRDSVPGHDLGQPDAAARELFDADTLSRYASTLRKLAKPYRVDSKGKPAPAEIPAKGSVAAGAVSTVRDLARYDAALDDHILLRPDTLVLAWTNSRFGGRTFPTGLGWFVQAYEGQPVIWQFGLWADSFSSLVVKVPGRHTTLILLANSDGLSAPFRLGATDVTSSVFARLFLRLFA